MQLHTILITLPPDESTTHGVGGGGGGEDRKQTESSTHGQIAEIGKPTGWHIKYVHVWINTEKSIDRYTDGREVGLY